MSSLLHRPTTAAPSSSPQSPGTTGAVSPPSVSTALPVPRSPMPTPASKRSRPPAPVAARSPTASITSSAAPSSLEEPSSYTALMAGPIPPHCDVPTIPEAPPPPRSQGQHRPQVAPRPSSTLDNAACSAPKHHRPGCNHATWPVSHGIHLPPRSHHPALQDTKGLWMARRVMQLQFFFCVLCIFSIHGFFILVNCFMWLNGAICFTGIDSFHRGLLCRPLQSTV